MNNTKTIIYTGYFRFPDKDAAAARVLGIGKILREIGYNVIFYGISDEIITNHVWNCYDGFEYINEPASGKKFNAVKRMFRMPSRLKAIINDKSKEETIAGVIFYNSPVHLISKLYKECKRKKIAMFADCTEWYSPLQFKGGVLNPFWWDSEIRMRYWHKKIGNIICISSYLEKYYQKSCKVLRLPPLVDMTEEKWDCGEAHGEEHLQQLNLVYAGTPGRKDNMLLILKSIIKLREQGKDVRLHCFGPDRRDFINVLRDESLINDMSDGLILHGKIPQANIPKSLATCDFSIFLRPTKQYSQAGFPTKFVESFAASVPVICNESSDIMYYLQSGINGLLVGEFTITAICEVLNMAINLSHKEKLTLRYNAKRCAEDFFDYKPYIHEFEVFIENSKKI